MAASYTMRRGPGLELVVSDLVSISEALCQPEAVEDSGKKDW